MRIHVFEDAGVENLEPLALTRPAFHLRCGAATLLERQLRFFGGALPVALLSPDRADLCRLTNPELTADAGGPARVLVSARWLAPAPATVDLSEPAVYLVDGEAAFVVPPAGQTAPCTAADLAWHLEAWKAVLPQRAAGGALLRYPWDLVERNGAALEDDWRFWYAERDAVPLPPGVTLLGPPDRLRVDPEARLEPQVVVDTRKGPVLVDRGAVVQAFSRLEGPCYVGPRTQILAARVRGSSFGPECRVGGEVECSVVQGNSNKAHEGFLGHSYLGEWVNLAAGTQTSDLRTDYGPVRMAVAGRKVDTGLVKVGSFLGDHTKTSVNVLFNTGSTVGAFAQLLTCGALLPRVVPSFCRYSHGRLHERTDLGDMFATAATVMTRRNQSWTDAHAEFFFDLYERTAAGRRTALWEGEQRRLRQVV